MVAKQIIDRGKYQNQHEEEITRVDQLSDEKFYRVSDLQSILKNLGLNFSIFSIRDNETWKCIDYKCGKRHNEKVTACETCGGPVKEPIIPSPRTIGGGRGVGHRRYTGAEIKNIVQLFQQRI